MGPNDFHCVDQIIPHFSKYFLLCATEDSKSDVFIQCSIFIVPLCCNESDFLTRTVEQNVFDYGRYWCGAALKQCCKRIWSGA